MSLPESIAYLRRYQAWRNGKDERDFQDTGLTPDGIGHAIERLLTEAQAIHVLKRELSSTKSQLKKCQIDREKFHSQLRRSTKE